jgi:hypothetical protein
LDSIHHQEEGKSSSASGTLSVISINHRKFLSSSISSSFAAWIWSNIIINNNSVDLELHHHHHEAGTSTSMKKTTQSWINIIISSSMKLEHQHQWK